MNVALNRSPPLRPDGGFGSLSEAAVMEFQNMLRLVPDGRVTEPLMEAICDHAVARGWIETPKPGGRAPWLELAKAEAGVREVPGLEAEPRILEYIATFPYLAQIRHDKQPLFMGQTDETAWCACFVNWCLIRAGQHLGKSARAKDWLDDGVPLTEPAPGAICVIYNPDLGASTTALGWHVGFWTGAASKGVRMIGGNQGNRVSDQAMPGEVKGLRWPG